MNAFYTLANPVHDGYPLAPTSHRRRSSMLSSLGMTIAELMVALTVIGVAFTALAMAQVTSLHVTRASTDAAVARDAALQKLELIRTHGYAAFRFCPDVQPVLSGAPACAGTEVLASNTRFTLSWVVDSYTESSIQPAQFPTRLEARVTVTWANQTYELIAVLSCAEIGTFSTTQVACSQARSP